MRAFLCISVVFLFATTAAAQFGNKAPTPRTTAKVETTPRKTAEKGRGENAAKVADQATAETDLANALLAIMDTDGDGVVTKVEYRKALAALNKVHKDSKGNIAVEKPADPGAANAAGDPAQGIPNNGPQAGGRGNEAMARFMNYDTNHDGMLSRNEVSPQEWRMAEQAGLVHNNAITAREWGAFSQKMGDRLRAGAVGIDPKNAGGVPGDGGRKQP